MTVNKNDIAKYISLRFAISFKESRMIVDKIFEFIEKAVVNGDEVTISRFGKFRISKSMERNGYSPFTGEPFIREETMIPKFKASRILKEKIKNKYKMQHGGK